MLEEKFFLMYEEADWCYRATRHGHKCIFVPGAKVWHKVSRAFGGERTPLHQYFIVRNRLLWAKRNLPFRRRLRVWRSVVAEICRDMSPSFDVPSSGKFSSPKELYWEARENLADWIVKLRRAKLRAELLGLRDYILGRFGKPDSMLQMMTTISDRKV